MAEVAAMSDKEVEVLDELSSSQLESLALADPNIVSKVTTGLKGAQAPAKVAFGIKP